jgi:hypothetical protein
VAHVPAVEVVLDDRRRFLRRRLGRALGAGLGLLVLAAGLLATLLAVPATLALAFWVLGRLTDDPEADRTLAEAGLRADALVPAAALTVGLALAGVWGGLRLLRGRRRTVLFLRRFGFDDGTRVVTFAALRTVGQGWRLVTLDDEEIVPVGASGAGVVRAGDRVWRAAGRARSVLGRLARPLAVLLVLPWVVVAVVVVQAGGPAAALESGALEPYAALIGAVAQGDLPFDAVGPDALGLFALGVSAVVVWLAALAALAAVALLSLALLPLLVLTSVTADSVRAAEQARTRSVRDAAGVELAVADLAARSRKVLAPRLVVLEVATAQWRRAVSRLGTSCDITLVDVSEPTEHLLWEIEELTVRSSVRCVLVAERGRILALTGAAPPAQVGAPAVAAPGLPPRGRVADELLGLLAGRSVLAYTTDRAGVRRFARALRARLYAVEDEPAPGDRS